jgi:hypothetical protein
MGGRENTIDKCSFGTHAFSFNTYHEPFVGSGAMFFRYSFGKETQTRCPFRHQRRIDRDLIIAIRDHASQVAGLYPNTLTGKIFTMSSVTKILGR